MRLRAAGCACVLFVLGGCAPNSGGITPSATSLSRAAAPAARAKLRVPHGFTIATVARISSARELAALPNGDLLVGTEGSQIYIVPHAESRPRAPRVFATIDDSEAAGVAYSVKRHEIYVGTTDHVWAIAYRKGLLAAARVRRIANVRTGASIGGDVHTTTSVAFDDGSATLFVSVGSSCNACTETDPTRAAILEMPAGSSTLAKRATRIRNAMALAIDPVSADLWAGGAGQDDLPFRHPYEYLDDVSSHPGVADYGWPQCEENHHAYTPGAHCAKAVEPRIELPAYSTIIGATFYPASQTGAHVFPASYRGGLFAAVHGSWHTRPNGAYAAPPQVVYVPMRDGRPKTPVNWTNPRVQWRTFAGGFQSGGTQRSGRPTGIAVGSQGSLFVADDDDGVVYRIRPAVTHP